jgi:hypothetical protein
MQKDSGIDRACSPNFLLQTSTLPIDLFSCCITRDHCRSPNVNTLSCASLSKYHILRSNGPGLWRASYPHEALLLSTMPAVRSAPSWCLWRTLITAGHDTTTCMASWLLTLGIIFIVIAIFLMLLGFLGKVAWTIGKWLIIIFVVLALLSWLFSVL